MTRTFELRSKACLANGVREYCDLYFRTPFERLSRTEFASTVPFERFLANGVRGYCDLYFRTPFERLSRTEFASTVPFER
ncbi:MAG: hypothetical protein D6765_17465, partial [Bacteroidetes bacterium]